MTRVAANDIERATRYISQDAAMACIDEYAWSATWVRSWDDVASSTWSPTMDATWDATKEEP